MTLGNSEQVDRLYRPHTDHSSILTHHIIIIYNNHITFPIPTTYQPPLLTTYQPHTDHIQTTYRPRTDRLCQPHTNQFFRISLWTMTSRCRQTDSWRDDTYYWLTGLVAKGKIFLISRIPHQCFSSIQLLIAFGNLDLKFRFQTF